MSIFVKEAEEEEEVTPHGIFPNVQRVDGLNRNSTLWLMANKQRPDSNIQAATTTTTTLGDRHELMQKTLMMSDGGAMGTENPRQLQ